MKFIQAANFTAVQHRTIDLLVIHDMEMPETVHTAEDCAHFFASQRKGPNGSSAHYCLDNNSIVQSVRDHDVAWAAPGANHDGLHFELAGRASQTKAEWRDKFDMAMLKIAAVMFARKAHLYHIPMRHVLPQGLVAGHSGITTHRDITDSGIGGPTGTHQDPGPNFPMGTFIQMVRDEYANLYRQFRRPVGNIGRALFPTGFIRCSVIGNTSAFGADI